MCLQYVGNIYQKIWFGEKEFIVCMIYKYQTESKFLKFGCPYIKFINEFYIVPIEVLIETVHIVQRFDHNNAYFVNIEVLYICW